MAGKKREGPAHPRDEARLLRRCVRTLFRKAWAWNRIAKAAVGVNRMRAYRQKRRALERIRALCPQALLVDGMAWSESGLLRLGLTVRGCGRLHLVLRSSDHAPGGPWEDLALRSA